MAGDDRDKRDHALSDTVPHEAQRPPTITEAGSVNLADKPLGEQDARAILRQQFAAAGIHTEPDYTIHRDDFALTVDGAFELGGFVFKGGVPFIHNDEGNTAVGLNALVSASSSMISNGRYASVPST